MATERRMLFASIRSRSRHGKKVTFVIVVGTLAYLSYQTFKFSTGETNTTVAGLLLNLSAGFLGALASFIIFEYHHYMSRNWDSTEKIAITEEQLLTTEAKLRATQKDALEKFQLIRRLDKSAGLAGDTQVALDIKTSQTQLRDYVLIPLLDQNYLSEQAVILGRLIAQYGLDTGNQKLIDACQIRYEQTQEHQRRALLILQKARDDGTKLDEICELLQKAIVEGNHD